MRNERRTQDRVSLAIKARLTARTFAKANADGERETVIANLSGGGAFLQSQQKLPLATKVALAFTLSMSEIKRLKLLLSINALRNLKQEQVLLEATGVVIRQEEDGVGVIFDANYQFTPMKAAR